MTEKCISWITIAMFVCVLLLFHPAITRAKKTRPPSESEILSSIETIIDSRDKSKSDYLRRLASKNSSSSVRSRAIGALMLLSDGSAVPLLTEKLNNDPSPIVRRAAAYAMSEMKSHLLINPLLRSLENDSDPIVRAISARALGIQESRDQAKILLSYIMVDPSYQVRIESAVAIGHLQLEGAAESLKFVITKDPERLVRIAAIKALSSFNDRSALNFLLREFDTATDLDIRFELYKGIITVHDSGKFLKIGLQDGDERIRFLALRKITENIDYQKRGLLKSKEVPLLKDMLSDPFKGIRDLANDTLNRMGFKTKDLGVRYEVVR